MAAVPGLMKRLLGIGKAAEMDVDEAWAGLIGHSPILYGLPGDTLAEMASRLEGMPVKKGDVIIRQGEVGDAFYIIVHGKVKVTQKETPVGKEVRVGNLTRGFGFGEEALLSDRPRNATVTMATDGLLVRLRTADFNELLKKPKLKWVAPLQAERSVKKHGAVWLDVRSENEFADGSLEGAVSAPLLHLRSLSTKLDRSKPYICVCRTSRLSAAAAYVLDQLGFQAAVLRGGLDGLDKKKEKGMLLGGYEGLDRPGSSSGRAAVDAQEDLVHGQYSGVSPKRLPKIRLRSTSE